MKNKPSLPPGATYQVELFRLDDLNSHKENEAIVKSIWKLKRRSDKLKSRHWQHLQHLPLSSAISEETAVKPNKI